MSQLTAIIIDDETIARETLRGYVERYCEGVKILDECANIKEAKDAIEKHCPDMIFLDIEMPFGNGFDLLEQLDEVNFETVFVTAFSNYAIQALNQSAAYYILKPIDIDELTTAVEKIKQVKANKNALNHTSLLLENLRNNGSQKLALPLMDGYEIVKVEDISRCQANDNFTDFHLTDGRKIMICRTLKFYEGVLSEFGFFRIHKSHLINKEYVTKYLKGKGGQVVMSDGSTLDVSPTKKKEFLRSL